jgi:hypothetical protein
MPIFALQGPVALRSQMLIQLVLAGKTLDIEDAIATRTFLSSFLLVNRSDMSVQVSLSPERLSTSATAEGTSKRFNVNVDNMSLKLLACVKFGFYAAWPCARTRRVLEDTQNMGGRYVL